jgi:1,4-alpha-glucan branching enzyme
MTQGYLALVLHAHLPYVRHRKEDECLEERWLYEAMSESYIPLLQNLDALDRDGVDFRLTISLSPTLLAMLDDVELMTRYKYHLHNLLTLAEKEVKLDTLDSEYIAVAQFYRERIQAIIQFMNDTNWYLIDAFRKWKDKGKVELITSCATHGFLPYMMTEEAIHAQMEIGLQEFERLFGERPKGMWLPECGYSPGVDRVAKACGVEYVFVETHALEHATPHVRRGIHAPLQTPYGVKAFARDKESSKQVWSSMEGYPGDYDYREYYRDIGFERDMDYILPHVHSKGIRLHTGLKYNRITGQTEFKAPYNPKWAREKAASHAGHFLDSRIKQVQHLASQMDRAPLITSPYDCELFGHWWFEGPDFLGYLFRKIHFDQETIQLITPSEYLNLYTSHDTGMLPQSTWGRDGYGDVWLEGSNDWIYRHLHKAERHMIQLTQRFAQSKDKLITKALQQAGRELLLAQSSDWPFIMENGTTTAYAVRRFKQHIAHFNTLFDYLIHENPLPSKLVAQLEEETPLFENLDIGLYLPKQTHPGLVQSIKYNEYNKRILMLSWEYPPKVVGGLSRAVCHLSEELVGLGWEVHVLTSCVQDAPAYEKSGGVHVHRLSTLMAESSSHFNDWIFSLNLAVVDFVRRWTDQGGSFDLIHCHDWLLAEAAARLKHHYGWPLLATVHATEHGRHQGLHNDIQHKIHHQEWKLTNEAQQIIVCSQYMRQEIKQLFNLPEDKIEVIFNGVREPSLKEAPLPEWLVPAQNRDERLIFFIGRLVREKGPDLLLEAIPDILHHYPKTRFILAGKGPMLEQLHHRAQQLSIAHHVVLPGFIDDRTRDHILTHAYAAVFPSLYEPFGIAVLEAMSTGTPVIVSHTGGLAEIIQHGKNGLTVYPGDVASIQNQLIALLSDPNLATSLGRKGRLNVRVNYRWDHIAKHTADVYSKMMTATHTPVTEELTLV